MNRRYLSLLLCTLMCFHLSANINEDSLHVVAHQAWTLYNPLTQFSVRQSTYNPALRYYLPTPSITTILLKGQGAKEHQLTQEQAGDRYRLFSLEAESMIALSSSTFVWGGASYHNGKVDNIRFNNTSDLDKVYPYVMADNLGGFLKSETYQFHGGYLHNFSSIYTLGVDVSYRALMAHRDKDPRPKNTVSDLQLRLGGSRTLGSNYHLGLAGYIQKYKQDNSIKFVSDLNVRPIYHLSGLGMRAVRFDGTSLEAQYDGWGYGGTLSFNHNQQQGWRGEVNYEQFSFDKIMNDLRDATLQSIQEDKWTTTIGYQQNNWAIEGMAHWKKRIGTEYLFGTPEGGHYPVIGSEKPYEHLAHEYSIRGIWKYTTPSVELFLAPKLAYQLNEESYQDPHRYLKRTSLIPEVETTTRWTTLQGGILTLESGWAYHLKLSSSHLMTLMTDLQTSDVMNPLMQQELHLLDQKEIAGHASIRWDLPFYLFKSYELFVKADWAGRFIESYQPMHQFQLSVGVQF